MRVGLTTLILLVALKAFAAESRIERDVPYTEPQGEKQTLDIYAPAEAKDHPIVFWIHGGGWMQGDKADIKQKPQAFVEKGFVFVSTNYRLFPHVTIKVIAEDVAKAIRWTHDHAQDFGGDPHTIFVMGHSAGAQLAALVCTDNRYLRAEGLPLAIVKGCVPVDGDTYDVPLQIATVDAPRQSRYRWKFGDDASQKELSPITHVVRDKAIPPFLFLYVAEHPETQLQGQRLAKTLTEAGVSAQTFAAEGKTHDTLNDELGLPDDAPSKALFDFVERVLAR